MQVIEFLGSARAGKSTQVKLLKDYLESKGKKVGIIWDRDRIESLKVPVTESIPFILAHFGKTIEEYYQLQDCDVIIMDRGFHDILTWINVRYNFREISVEERDRLIQCLEPYTKLVSKVFFFNLPVEKSLQRHELVMKQEEVDDLVMNEKWLDVLNQVYARQDLNGAVVIDGKNSIEETHEKLRRYFE